jgi:hypothetical protein
MYRASTIHTEMLDLCWSKEIVGHQSTTSFAQTLELLLRHGQTLVASENANERDGSRDTGTDP